MMTRCFFCHQAFAPNGTIELFPVARRVAYDPERGRLWAVCPSCRRWSLAPMEERWEVLEALERLARDRGRVRASTDSVSLVRAGDAELVRIGRETGLREESHWRYAAEYAARLRRAELVETVGEVLDGVTTIAVLLVSTLLAGAPMDPEPDPDKWMRWARMRRFGRRAWAGDLSCAGCGEPLVAAGFEERGGLVLEGSADVWKLRRLCPSCGAAPESGALLPGLAAEHTLRRVLAYENFGGATTGTIGDAMVLLDEAGSSPAFLERVSARPLSLGRIPRRVSVALEIAVTERTERQLLALELAALERRWREEEVLARIVDGELTPVAGVRS